MTVGSNEAPVVAAAGAASSSSLSGAAPGWEGTKCCGSLDFAADVVPGADHEPRDCYARYKCRININISIALITLDKQAVHLICL